MHSLFIKKFNIEGILLLDKPHGISSNYALQKVKKIYTAKRAGYIGTLDPIATGMLPICFGQATKFSQFLLNTDKRYYVVAKLGQKTNTFDSSGIIVEEKKITFNTHLLEESINSFLGIISQIPPIYSAVKYNGIPLYKYARKNMKIPILQPKNVTVYDIKVIYYRKKEIALNIHCSKGTYIRSIINELGNKLGCGAHVIILRRLQLAKYSEKKMITIKYLQDLTKKFSYENEKLKNLISLLLSIDDFLYFLPEVNLGKKLVLLLKTGITIPVNNIDYAGLKNSLVRITEGTVHAFVGVAEINSNGFIVPHRFLF